MMKRSIGQVSPEESKQIEIVSGRRDALTVLARTLAESAPPDREDLYAKLVDDLVETQMKFQAWWDRMCAKYGFESQPGGNWEIDFETGVVTLVCASKET